MVVKFGKTFKLTIQMNDNPNKAIVIEPPFTIDFDINRDMEATANTGNFKIYNLSPSTRKEIFQDLFDLSSIRKIIFEAGYNQAQNIADFFSKDGNYKNIEIFKDLAGIERVVTAVKK